MKVGAGTSLLPPRGSTEREDGVRTHTKGAQLITRIFGTPNFSGKLLLERLRPLYTYLTRV